MKKSIQPPKLADAIADHLQQLIFEGVLRPGEKLAPERELAEKFDVSRPSLREALEKLASTGLIVTDRGGSSVARFLKPLADPLETLFRDDTRVLPDYFEFRETLEAKAASLAAERATKVERDAIKAIIAKMTEAHKLDDPRPEAEADIALHLLIYEAAHNVVLLHFMSALSGMLRHGIMYSREQLYRRPGVRDVLLAQHKAIADAVISGKPGDAAAAAVKHISYSAKEIEAIRKENERLESALRRVGRSELLSK